MKNFKKGDLGNLLKIFLSISSFLFRFPVKSKKPGKKRILIFCFEFFPICLNSFKQKFNILSLSSNARVNRLYFEKPSLVRKKLNNFPWKKNPINIKILFIEDIINEIWAWLIFELRIVKNL